MVITKGSIRRKSKQVFEQVIRLRKLGHSYTEIRKSTGIAKSTINNWLNFAGLTFTTEHLQISESKRLENHALGTLASKITREGRKNEEISKFVQNVKQYFNDPFFVAGIILYEAEGSKSSSNGFSNSDFRLVQVFIKFLEKYVQVDRLENLIYRLYIHETRKDDLAKITNFWSKKMGIKNSQIRISWKHNIVTKRRLNPDYLGQMEVRVIKYPFFLKKIMAVSDIILTKYQKI